MKKAKKNRKTQYRTTRQKTANRNDYVAKPREYINPRLSLTSEQKEWFYKVKDEFDVTWNEIILCGVKYLMEEKKEIYLLEEAEQYVLGYTNKRHFIYMEPTVYMKRYPLNFIYIFHITRSYDDFLNLYYKDELEDEMIKKRIRKHNIDEQLLTFFPMPVEGLIPE